MGLLFTTVPAGALAGVEGGVELAVEGGGVPAWVHGVLYRNGAGDWSVGQAHLFDGFALLQRYAVGDGRVTLTARKLGSRAAVGAAASGRLTAREFGSDPAANVFSRLWSTFVAPAPPTDNANVNIMPLAGELVALSELPSGYVVDADTLATGRQFSSLTAPRSGDLFVWPTAHAVHHAARGAVVNLCTRFQRGAATYEVTVTPDGAAGGVRAAADGAGWEAAVTRATVRHALPATAPSYHHSFALTERYAVIFESPKRFSLPSMLWALTTGAPMTDMFPWQAATPSRFLVVDLASGALAATADAPPAFMFHVINAYERGDDIVVDLCAYDDDAIINRLAVADLAAGKLDFAGGRFRRFVVHLPPRPDAPAAGDAAAAPLQGSVVEATPAAAAAAGVQHELPSVNPAHVGRLYRYAWAARMERGAGFNGVVKFDVEAGTAITWAPPNVAPGEPIYVPRPGAAEEDDGVVLVVCLDAVRATSFLAVLDGASLAELARAYNPPALPLPLSFHGTFRHHGEPFGGGGAPAAAVAPPPS